MKSARSRLFFLSLLVLGTLAIAQVCAAEEASTADRSSKELEGIKAQLATLDQQEKQILANQDQIFDKLDQLRIWVHRK